MLVVVAACNGDAVTGPLREFTVDPTPILGTWHMLVDGEADSTYTATIEAGAGVLFGEFTFPMWSQDWRVTFADVPWNGERVQFTDDETFGIPNKPFTRWSLFYWPGSRSPLGQTYPAFIAFDGLRGFRYVRPGVQVQQCPEPLLETTNGGCTMPRPEE